ncbi:MAG TPA: zf-HC2 domain-containing protein [Candidatus Binatia bacterium]|nr:zf-HC2 domain-containing protein [Candidatus Binatia bacterium]
MMTCRDMIEVLADYLDQTLPPEVAAALEHHLAGCEPCRAYLATYRRTRALGAQTARLAMPDEMKARLRRFLLERLA